MQANGAFLALTLVYLLFAVVVAVDDVLIVHSLIKVRPDKPIDSFHAIQQLSCAQNEYESFQVVVANTTAAVKNVNVNFRATPIIEVLVHRSVINHHCQRCDGDVGRWPDALIRH